MQNDFIDGALGTEEAEEIVPDVIDKIAEYIENGDEVIFTRDTHQKGYLKTNEGRHLPVEHCIEGTHGWELAPGVYVEGCEIIDKPSFGYTGWGGRDFEKVELVGLCTDICVISNALIIKALYPEIPVSVDPMCCAGVTPESHEAALETMQMCQVDLVTDGYGYDEYGDEEEKADLLIGEMLLEAAVRNYHNDPSDENFRSLFACMAEENLWVPFSAYFSEGSGQMKPDIMEVRKGEFYFPVFSSMELFGDYGQGFSKFPMDFMAIVDLLEGYSDETLEGIVLNAFTTPVELPMEMLREMKKLLQQLIDESEEE